MLDLLIGGAVMRPVRLTRLVVMVALLLSAPWVSAKEPSRKNNKEPQAVRAQGDPTGMEMNRSWTVEGWGNTYEDAWQRALENARMELLVEFAKRQQPLQWQPSLDFISKLVKDPERLHAEDFGEPLQRVEGVRLVIEVSPTNWQKILHKDREARSESRMLSLGRVLVGLVAALGAVAGYLRLEEMTKGYYTAWLRLAALGFVTAVGAGIWWVS
jgi:hypothetical protein